MPHITERVDTVTVCCTQYGISGAFWYASGATIQILLFSMLTVQLKLHAPGAKTFLQVIRARVQLKLHSPGAKTFLQVIRARVQLKLHAPGAKTFLQVIRARFGRTTHVTFCVFALLTNVIVTAMLMLGN